MSEREINTIAHLLEVEQNANALTFQAQTDADKKIAAAKSQADSEFQSQYRAIVENCEKSFIEKSTALENEKNKKITDYKSKIMASSTDSEAFNSFLDSVLFA